MSGWILNTIANNPVSKTVTSLAQNGLNNMLCSKVYLVITNKTKLNIEIGVYEYDDFDWSWSENEHIRSLEGAQIPSGKTLKKTLVISSHASKNPFTMDFRFSDHTVDTIRLNMKHAVDANSPLSFEQKAKKHRVTVKKVGNKIEVTIEN